MKNLNEIRGKYYFSYSKKESDFLKDKGFIYITKALHPQTKVIFTVYEKDSNEFLEALKEYRQTAEH